MTAIREGLRDILESDHPMTVRQVFYRAVAAGLIGKTEDEYKTTVVRLLTEMRENEVIPFDWIVDSTRRLIEAPTWSSPKALLLAAADQYRSPLWRDAEATVYILTEKDTLSGTLQPITNELDVPLGVFRGDPSITFMHDIATRLEWGGRAVFVYYLGDHDPSGLDIERDAQQRLRRWAMTVDITWKRVAVTPKQIAELSLPTRPTKPGTRNAGFKGESVEVDAIEPKELQRIVRAAIMRHIDAERVRKQQMLDEKTRASLRRFAKTFRGGAR
jgi:hypothetical protein